MPTPDDEIKELLFKYLRETGEIYTRIKQYSILIEKLHPEQKAPIHSANELRGVVFHFYKAVEQPEHAKANLHESKEHLCRAFYDLHSMVVSLYIKQITSKVSEFKLETIAAVSQEYLQTIKPTMRAIQKNLIEIRSNRNTDIDLLRSGLPRFQEHVDALETFSDIIDEETPNFIKYEKEQADKKEQERREEAAKRRKDKRWDLAKIFITILLTGTATYFITVWSTKKKIELEKSIPSGQVIKKTGPGDSTR